MKKRQIIILLVATLILAVGKFGKDFMAEPKEKQAPINKQRVITVFTDEVALEDITIQVSSTGSLMAKDRMELFSEVQGLMLPDNGRFKAGNRFSKGQTLLSLRSDDAGANVVAQRSSFERSLSAIMADIRIDYPSEFSTWDGYLKAIDVNTPLPSLPEVRDTKLKSYLTGRSIYSTFYSVRNAEIMLSRYHITAPFSGVLTSANVNPGTVVRPGQALGVFVKPGLYELQASTDSRTASRLSLGQKVKLHTDGDNMKEFEGFVKRVNASIDPQTQMSDFFVEVRSEELSEGQFMKVDVQAETVENSYVINRSAIKDTRYVYLVENGALKSKEIHVLHTDDKTAIINGLKNGEVVLTTLPPAAFEGMKVNIYAEKPEQ